MKSARVLTMLVFALAEAAFVAPVVSAAEGPENAGERLGRWEELPLPPSKAPQVHCMVMEPGGTVWIMTDSVLYYWNGKGFAAPLGGQLTTGQYLTSLYGGPDRGAYATQKGQKEHWGRLYRLSDGEARYLADLYYEASNRSPCLYVSERGKVYNWGNRFLAVYSAGGWKRIEAELDLENTLIFDTGEVVHFYFNQKLYSADADDNLTEHHIPSSTTADRYGVPRVHGALWGSGKMMILKSGEREVYAYDLNNCEPVPIDNINAAFGERPVWDLFRTADGSVWVLTQDPRMASCLFCRVSPDGQVTPIEEAREFTWPSIWDNTRCLRLPHSVLNSSDGSIWFGLLRGGIARHKEGKVTIFGWREGVSAGSVEYLFEDPRGSIYAASSEAVYVFRPGEPPAPLPAGYDLWEEYLIVSYPCRPIRDSDGNVWMFLKDHPGEFSRWDGYQWHHVKVPFDTSKVSRAMADDRGHILVEMSQYPEGCFDVSRDGVKHYENLEAMLVGAVGEGAKRFYTDRQFQGCYVLEGGKIWYGYQNYNRFMYFDGERWDIFSMGDDISYMYESPKYGILIRTSGGKYYTVDRGQIVEVECPRNATSRWILGPKNLQPFEEELLKLHPELYAATEVGRDGQYRLLYGPTRGSADSSEGAYVMGDALPQGARPLTPGYFGGYWMEQFTAVAPYRIIAGKVFPCDFKNTPLAGREEDIGLVVEDKAHNLWIDAGWDGRARHVFLKRLDGFKLKIGEVPTNVKRSVHLTAEPVLPGLQAKDLRLFWRLDGGLWQGGDQGNSATIRFPADGEYEIEVMGMGPEGGTSQASTLVVNATVPLPETRLTDEGPYKVKDVVWLAPVDLVPSEPGCLPELSYRTDGGEWKIARDSKIIPMGGLEPGEHVVEVAAQEDEEYRDPTPVCLRVTYRPNFEFIVESRLDIITGDDAKRASEALSEIKTAGPGVIPVLKQKLSEARKAVYLLERLLRGFAGQESGPP